ncbi:MAG: lipase family alpha/beta hydrolase [Candidatus Hodarchaeales archaeon]
MISSKNIELFFITLLLISFGFISTGVMIEKSQTSSVNQNPILFLHGWTKYEFDWDKMRLWFQGDGWPETMLYANRFDDTYNCSGQTHINHAEDVKDWVDDILTQTGAIKVDLVGHSSGGLSSRYYVKFLNGTDKVDDLVTLASCNHGTTHNAAATCFSTPNDLDLFLIKLNEGDETPGGILNDTIGDRVDSVLNTTYNGTNVPGNINYTSIYSLDDDLMIPRNSSILEGAYNIEITGVDHSMYETKFVYELVKAAVYDPVATASITSSAEISVITTSTTSSAEDPVTTTTTTASSTSLIEMRDILLFMGILVILKHINRKKYKF